MNIKVLDSFWLKLIAILTMVIDHVGAVFFPQVEWIRCIGRISFPIFCFLLVEGYFHTRNVKKYLLRLGIFAFLSEIPFDLLFIGREDMWNAQNIFFTLFIGLAAVYCMDLSNKRWSLNYNLVAVMNIVILLAACGLAWMLKTDYSLVGVLYILVFYLYRGRNGMIFVVLGVITFAAYNGFVNQIYAILAVPIIACYNGKKGRSMKYFFYVFYPAHLLILAAIYYGIYGVMPS